MIIMQYADGGDLHNYLQNNFKNITWEDKLTILLEISRGVDCIHKENYIHRDLHSGNILLVNGKWHIGDLGLSRPANVISSNDEIYGVIPYVAPEIFNGNKFSKESDIYSFGMTMWELTAGCKPFAGIDHDTDLIYNIIDGKRPEITDDTPECFANLMKKCWESDSSKRPHIKEIRKTIALWRYAIKNIFHSYINLEDADKFNQAEEIRLGLMKINELDPRFAVNYHPGAIYTSRLLNPLISESLSISNLSSSSTSFNKKQEHISKDLEFDINNFKRLSLSELNSTTQNSKNNIQCSNVIYTSRPLNEMMPIKKEYNSKEIELDINDAQWSPLPDVNSTVQNSLYKIAEIKTETQDNEKLV
ncbi:kinase-like domain-containing protein [Rhizophagus diaphanus]|nr:kinase-like domain-containing protein [Rhizophagus diaphanus] [Rhizophagus sp. MUCL 43196]